MTHSRVESMSVCCKKCGTKTDLRTLFDGFSYCTTCIQEESRDLWHFSAHNTVFEETVVADRCAHRRILASVSLLNAIFWMTVAFVVAELFLIAMSFMFAVPAVLWLKQYFAAIWLFPRRIAITRGTVAIRSPKHEYRAPLQRCHWYCGDTCQDREFLVLPVRKAVILEMPNGQPISCGSNEGSLLIVRAFLRLARIPHIKDMTSKSQHIRLLQTVVIVGVSAGLVGLGFGALLARGFGGDLIQNCVVHAGALGGCGIVWGIVGFGSARRPAMRGYGIPVTVVLNAGIGFLSGSIFPFGIVVFTFYVLEGLIHYSCAVWTLRRLFGDLADA